MRRSPGNGPLRSFPAKNPKRVDNQGGGGSIYVYINQVHVYVCVYIHILTISVFSGYEVLVVKESGVTKGIISHWVFGPVVCNSCVAAHAPAHASFTCPYYRQNHANRKALRPRIQRPSRNRHITLQNP